MKNRVCEVLGIEKPVIGAAMSWVSNAEWAAAISNAGGLGCLGPNCGATEPTDSPEETGERLRQEIRKTRELTDKPFTVNYLLPIEGIEATYAFAGPVYQVLKEENQKIILTSGAVVNEDEITRLKKDGFIIIHRDVCPTVDSLKKAEACGVDVLIATGYEAGGHMSEHRISLLSLFPQARAAVKLPLLAAGGICNAAGAKAVAAMGAEGAYVGTRFVVTEENPASMACKQAIINAKAEELVEFRGMIGHMRTTPNKVGLECERMSREGVDAGTISKAYAGGFRTGMLLGDLENGIVSVSEAIGMINEILTCQQVVDDIATAF
ncbi:NAD(P)H-dependent flavin oxidoreductase [Dehalobacterium formicoaceticum]|uniref:Probable nitronate monooxygenase n=1 Tax=Dehalobacterium formicoaceticum TaxID=51515 RepID=A0ABT1Y6E9_9FIRM|nr:nitronate monooxygenase [Dehalobacterium formicoaceticum]MCR6545680.1 nitronate monooxygenase [Dehalobacterium formicoaceticum]